MGSNNFTHHEGQVLAECPSCGKTIRLKGKTGISNTYCGRCNISFKADRRTGEIVDD